MTIDPNFARTLYRSALSIEQRLADAQSALEQWGIQDANFGIRATKVRVAEATADLLRLKLLLDPYGQVEVAILDGQEDAA